MELRVEHAGRLEWLVEPGTVVAAGAWLAQLQVEDHCAIVPLRAPRDGVVSWLLPAVLTQVAARTVVALLDATPAELAARRGVLRREVAAVLSRLEDDRRALEARCDASALERALLLDERVALERRLAEVRLLADALIRS